MVTIKTSKMGDNLYGSIIEVFKIESIGTTEIESILKVKFKLEELYENLKTEYLKAPDDLIRRKLLYLKIHWKDEPFFIYELIK